MFWCLSLLMSLDTHRPRYYQWIDSIVLMMVWMFVRGAALFLVCLEQIYHFPTKCSWLESGINGPRVILPRNSHINPSMPHSELMKRSISTGGSERGRQCLCDRYVQRASQRWRHRRATNSRSWEALIQTQWVWSVMLTQPVFVLHTSLTVCSQRKKTSCWTEHASQKAFGRRMFSLARSRFAFTLGPSGAKLNEMSCVASPSN